VERVLDLSRKAAGVFAEKGLDNPRLEAELLLAGVLGLKRLDLYLQHDRPVREAELQRFRELVRRRLRREPLQYLLGTAAFRQLELAVDSRVLIPRPETEVLVGAVLEWASARPGGTALDVGTGSGAIALSLALEGRFDHVVASDVAADALDVARGNAARCGLEGRVEFRCGALLDVAQPGERFRAIVANLPYVAEPDRAALQAEVRDHEPALALFAGQDGLDLIRSLVASAAAGLEPGGLLALEIGAGQEAAVLGLIGAAGGYTARRALPDLTGRIRIVLAERHTGEHEVEAGE
jgi:release factor glutamine methyltransferase